MTSLFKTKQPTLQPATKMPDKEDPSILADRRKRVAEDKARGGRDSTILSDNLVGATGKLGA
jgi:hypothetical protein